jgi:hypothetical protein
MLVSVTGSTKGVRTLVRPATWWYAEKLMGKRLMSGLEINVNLLKKNNDEGSCIWEDENRRPKEFTIDIDGRATVRNILITLAHEMVHLKQWAKDEMYEYMNVAGLVRFKGEKVHMEIIDYWDYPWEIEAYGKQLGLFVRFCEYMDFDRDDMKEEA